jgi:beta-galactosidase
MIRVILSGVTLLCLSAVLKAAPPRSSTLLDTWKFAAETVRAGEPLPEVPVPPADLEWQTVSIPHIFRQSGLPDDAAGWYLQTFTASPADQDRRFFLILEGAATVKDVFVNGMLVGRHKSAYTAAAFDLTPAIRFNGPNQLHVRVSNRDEETRGMLARSTLYFVNGGLFRHARLVSTGAVHIFPEFGSTGVYITPANVTAASADLAVRTIVRNPLTTSAEVLVRHTVIASDGSISARFEAKHTLPASQTAALTASASIASPKLWDLGRPNLYSVRTELFANGRPSDVVTEPTGFRTIVLRDKKLILNGREVQLRGVNKHAQTEYAWNAVSDENLRREWDYLRELGVNTVRLAHYPHSRFEYALADNQGVAIWAENGFAGHQWNNAQKEDKEITPDGERLTREMVRQNWNHPSILFWSCGNETVAATATRYAEVIREEDPSGNRLVTYAVSSDKPSQCDFLAFNTYQGWYGGKIAGFNRDPKNAFVSETGCGTWVTHHVPLGEFRWSVDRFEPEEYASLFTEHRLQTVCRDQPAKHPMFLWWTFREFYDRKFKQNRNTKGLLTLSGQPKDLYFLFKAFLNPDTPVVRLAGRSHFYRAFAPDNGIKAYSNTPTLELFINGVSQGRLQNGDYRLPPEPSKAKDGTVTTTPGVRVDNVFFWKAPLHPGRNVITVRDGQGHDDGMIVYQSTAVGPAPAAPTALVQDLRSSNPSNPAVFIDRPVEAQGPVYTDVDGSSDNTFDLLPPELVGASWIATRRLSDPANKSDLAFRPAPASAGATVFVLFSTGTHPTITLKPKNTAVVKAAVALSRTLTAAGFEPVPTPVVWRDHQLNRADAALWSRQLAPGETISLPGETLDYVILVKPASKPPGTPK